MSQFKMDIMVSKFDKGELISKIVKTGTKVIYNMDESMPVSEWVRQEVKKKKTFDAPQLTSAIKCKQEGRGKIVENSIGYFVNNSNNVYKNTQCVALFSQTCSTANGLSVTAENFEKVCAVFAARRTVHRTWINWQDEYMVPNTEHPDYEQWNNDAIVYTLFESKSQQSSLRNVDYKGKSWDIENQWFWMSMKEMKELANDAKTGNDGVWKDIKQFGEDRFVYNKLKSATLSKDAQELLDMATNLVKESFKYRETFDGNHPEYQINTWDAGWYQIKAMLKEYMPEELKKFTELYKKFEDRMRKGVYKFGFLKE